MTKISSKPSAGTSVAPATTTAQGTVQLAGDLAGTAAAPTVPGLATKAPITTTVVDLVDRFNDTNETVPAGATTNCAVAGVTKTAPAVAGSVGTPPLRFAVRNTSSGSIFLSLPDSAGTVATTTILPGEVLTLRQKTTLGWGSESGNKSLVALDNRYGQMLSLASFATLDCRTLTDAVVTAGSPVVTSASASFTAADIGKTVVLNLAGTVLGATSSSLLSTGGAITTIPVSALAATLPAGGITITSGANTQSFVTSGAAAGATTVPIASATPNFAYPSGSPIVMMAQPFKTTILSRQSATQVTLSANPITSVAVAEMVYGTDNYAAINTAMSTAIANGQALFIPSSKTFDGYLYDGSLSIPASLDFVGAYVHEKMASTTSSTDLTRDNIPTIQPYFEGSVLICAAQNVDAIISQTAVGPTHNMRHFGVRFAGKWVSTGHGINVSPPLSPGNAWQDHGMMNSTWDSVKVYGHDGNHYAFSLTNAMQNTFNGVKSYGGGVFDLYQNSNYCNYGNAVFTRPFGPTFVAGSANGYNIRTNPAYTISLFGLMTFINPQSYMQTSTLGPVPPTTSQKMLYSDGSSTRLQYITFIQPDFEVTTGSTAEYPVHQNCSIVGGGEMAFSGANGVSTNPTTGTAIKNISGSMAVYQSTFDLNPTTSAATVVCEVSTNSGMTSPTTVAEATAPANGLTGQRVQCTATIPAGYYFRWTYANATHVRSRITRFPAT